MSTLHFDESGFQTSVLSQKGTALVDFWAPWCGPCKMLGPVIDELAQELEGQVTVGKINVDEQPGLASRYGVMSIPTVIVFRDGTEVSRAVGVQPKAKLLAMIG